MFDMNSLIAPYVEQARPHVQQAAQTALAYAERTVTLLREIRDNGIDRDPAYRIIPMVWDPALVPIRVAEIPAGDTWILDAYAITGAAVLQVFSNGSLRVSMTAAAWGLAPPPAAFRGPCTVTALADTVSSGSLQFRVLAKRPRPTHWGGQDETGIAAIDAQRQHSPLHSGIGG